MFKLLSSVLLLGTVHATDATRQPFALPSLNLLSVSRPITLSITPRSISASGAMLLDVETGKSIFAYNANVARPTGSLAKIMTALIIMEHHPLNQVVNIPPIVDDMEGSSIGLKPGQTFTVESLLKAMLIPSANDAAYALAIHHSGTVQAFVEKMNERAVVLGLKDTRFQNPAGFDGAGQAASPRNLAWLSMAALRTPVFQKIVASKSAIIRSLEGKEYALENTNELLRAFDNVEGVKTGTTSDAGQCLITLFYEGERPFLLVIMGSRDRYRDARGIMNQVRVGMATGKHVKVSKQ